MRISVPVTAASDDPRVALTPEAVGKLVSKGIEVLVEADAGAGAGHPDDAYTEAGARIVDHDTALSSGEVLAVIAPPALADVQLLPQGTLVVGLLAPHRNLDVTTSLAEQGLTSFALELLPRISRAQTMDALSSQAGIAGYRAVVLAAAEVDKMFPLSMTAAGTVRPANVLVLGAGVAGLQAIATARRLGATVKANDVRAAAADEVASLGGEFIHIEGVTDQDDTTGYARSLPPDLATRQHEALLPHLGDVHVVLCTAAIPGRRAPVLLTRELVEALPTGALVFDLPSDDGGNCELTDPQAAVEHGGVRIVPAPQLARTMPREASALYARNVSAFLELLVGDDGELVVDHDDEVLAACQLTGDGTILHGPTAEAAAASGTASSQAEEEPS